MKYVLMLMLVLGLAVPCHAGQREDALLGDLLGIGARALEGAVEPAAPEAAAGTQKTQKGKKKKKAASAAASAAAQPLVEALTESIRESVDELANEYKAELKKEGRAYARELGNIVVERVHRDPEINATVTSLRTLCWCVIGYLTLVTLIMLASLLYLKRSNAHLLALVQELHREIKKE